MSGETLAACPLCRSSDVHALRMMARTYRAGCRSCGCMITRDTIVEAITAWNTRPTPTVEGGELVAHKIMTREEYDALNLQGWHCVNHTAEPGATYLMYGLQDTRPTPTVAGGDDDALTVSYMLGRKEAAQALTALLAENERLERLWSWLAENISLELSWGEADGAYEGDPCVWRVHSRSGGRNDREWDEIATGETPLEAVQNAFAALNKDPDQ